MPQIELLTQEEVDSFNQFKRYRKILGSGFRLVLHTVIAGTGLTKDEVGFLIKYLQNREKVNILLKGNIRGGQAVVHYDKDGNIRQINIDTIAFKS